MLLYLVPLLESRSVAVPSASKNAENSATVVEQNTLLRSSGACKAAAAVFGCNCTVIGTAAKGAEANTRGVHAAAGQPLAPRLCTTGIKGFAGLGAMERT